MIAPSWELDRQIARLRLEGVSGTLDAARPECGLHDVRIQTHLLGGAQLLGLAFPRSAERDRECSLECHHRGHDLIAAYSELPSWPVCADIVWRAISPAEVSDIVAGIDLIVSVRTGLLDSWPELAVRSHLAATEVLRVSGEVSSRFERCDGIPGPGCAFNAGSGPCVFVLRLPGLPFSYVEMTHPVDFQGTALAPLAENPAIVETRHRLFAERLEKGVILRARVRGVVIARARDIESAAACYGAFVAADPPLGT